MFSFRWWICVNETNKKSTKTQVIVTCTDTDDCVCASLPRWPSDFEKMEASLVANAAPDAVRRLGNRVTVKRQLVVVLDENVVRSGNVKKRFLKLKFEETTFKT